MGSRLHPRPPTLTLTVPPPPLPQESREQALESQLAEARWSSLQGALEEAQKIVQESLAQIDDPAHIGCTSSAGPAPPPHPRPLAAH